jgi:hypothetical protein
MVICNNNSKCWYSVTQWYNNNREIRLKALTVTSVCQFKRKQRFYLHECCGKTEIFNSLVQWKLKRKYASLAKQIFHLLTIYLCIWIGRNLEESRCAAVILAKATCYVWPSTILRGHYDFAKLVTNPNMN